MKNCLSYSKGSAKKRSLFCCLFLCLIISGCAYLRGPESRQYQVNKLLIEGKVTQAVDYIEKKEAHYGKKNLLLYYLDRGLLELMDQRYDRSILSFQEAKNQFQYLYTQSITDELLSWVINDYSLDYRGADYEYVLVNVFQAINFLLKNDLNAALVEARDLDVQYQVIEEIARQQDRKHFADNGFARFLMGVLFEWKGGEQNLCDALLFYRQAMALYDGFYAQTYTPIFLKENAAALVQQCGDEDLKQRLKGVAHIPFKQKQQQAEVLLLDFIGYSPIKESENLSIPIGDGMFASLAFPRLIKRSSQTQETMLVARNKQGVEVMIESVLGADIEEIAFRELNAKKMFLLTKSISRPILKALILRQQKENIAKKHGQQTGMIFGLLFSLYHMYSEQADTRSWQTLPAQIRVARLLLEPGEYELIVKSKIRGANKFFDEKSLGNVFLKSGEKRFFVRREWL